MELLKGQSLRERLGDRPFTLDSILTIGLQISDALDTAHKEGIVQRDIKPDNLFVGKNDHAKVSDFGLAKLTHSEPSVLRSTDSTHLQEGPVTRTGMPAYSAFSIDPHFVPLGDRSDFTALMSRVKVGWEALRAEFGSHG